MTEIIWIFKIKTAYFNYKLKRTKSNASINNGLFDVFNALR